MFILAFSMFLSNYTILASIIKKFPARENDCLKLLVFILFLKMATIKASASITHTFQNFGVLLENDI